MSQNIDDKIVYAKDLRPSTAKKIDSIVNIISEIAKAEYERGKEDEKRWWSGFCAKCTDEDRPQGKWVEVNTWEAEHHSVTDMRCSVCGKYASIVLPHKTRCVYDFCPFCGARMKGVNE